MTPTPGFPTARPRRLRHHPLVRSLVRETELRPDDFILPLFVRPGRGVRQEIGSMPGQYQLSVDRLAEEVGPALDLDGGAIEVLDVTGGVVQVRLSGVCAGCPATIMTVITSLEDELRKCVPEVEVLEAVP